MIIGRKRSTYNAGLSDVAHEPLGQEDLVNFVRRCLDRVLASAMAIISKMDEDVPPDRRREVRFSRSLSRFGTEWPTCGSLTVKNAFECIETEMTVWNSLPALKDWMFHIEFVGLKAEDDTEFYTYQVLWSIPTAAYPEPQVTVSVFFCIAASRVQPPHFPVDVTYVFEGHQFTHRLDMIFRPKWLYDILDMKTMMFKTFDF
ncbi:hypothetical protein KM043_017278 [Ampulex compressa]|nr:hypothetical protein KM043_017278 [Ampulex compressa]